MQNCILHIDKWMSMIGQTQFKPNYFQMAFAFVCVYYGRSSVCSCAQLWVEFDGFMYVLFVFFYHFDLSSLPLRNWMKISVKKTFQNAYQMEMDCSVPEK